MPVLKFDDTPKRFILPSTEGSADQGWAEMPTYPLCGDDYPIYYRDYFAWSEAVKTDPGRKEPLINHYVLARRITDWNYTDPSGAKLPIIPESLKHLPLGDISFLMSQIQDEDVEVLDETLKGTSSPTSSPSPTASQ